MDATQFKQQLLPYYPKLYRTAFRLTGNAADAEDLVQEAYLKLWKKRDELPVIANMEAYCITLAKNLYWDTLRQGHLEICEGYSGDLEKEADSNPGKEMEVQDAVNRVQTLLRYLPPAQRQVMVMRDIEECSFEEIQQSTGLSAVHIRVLLSRARKSIREQFRKE